MKHAKGQVRGSAAEVYESFFVPALFAPWAPRMAEAVAIEPGRTVLDVACGTGVLTRELARRARPAHVVGLDRNEDMLATARARAPDVRWCRGRAEALPFEDASFDAVTSQFGLMFFDDPVGALAQMWRVLRPGGRLALAVWGPLSATPGYAAMVELLHRLFGEAVANELRAPYALGEVQHLRGLCDRAGLEAVRIDSVLDSARFPSLEDWVHTDIRGWTLADKISDEEFEVLLREAKEALGHFVVDGRVVFDAPAHIVTARKLQSS